VRLAHDGPQRRGEAAPERDAPRGGLGDGPVHGAHDGRDGHAGDGGSRDVTQGAVHAQQLPSSQR